MKKMTAEQMELARTLVRDGFTVPLLGMALEHISALEAEAEQALEMALEEAARTCAEECDELAPESETCECDHHKDARLIRALKSKPAQALGFEVREDASMAPGTFRLEMASEANGLLPKKRRREHEYGEERPARFGSTMASCVREGCNAYRIKTRGGKATTFRQHPGAAETDEPGPCEVEP